MPGLADEFSMDIQQGTEKYNIVADAFSHMEVMSILLDYTMIARAQQDDEDPKQTTRFSIFRGEEDIPSCSTSVFR